MFLSLYLLHTLNPERWSHAFLASKMSSYTTNAVPLVSGVLPTLICLMAPYFPKMSYLTIIDRILYLID